MRYDDAAYSNPVEHAVVQVAIDWARVGRPDAIAEAKLISLARQMVWDEWPNIQPTADDLVQAVTTARTPTPGAGRVAMLTTSRLTHNSFGYRPFDFLVAADDGQDQHNERPITDDFWNQALSEAAPDIAFAVGASAYWRNKRDIALAGISQAAESGHVQAMNELGCLFERANPPEAEIARRWFERAAEAGNPDAMVNLGAYYAEDVDPPDLDGARHWYEKAAGLGNAGAMYNLGVLCLRADPPDVTRARAWFMQSAAGEHLPAMLNLGALAASSQPENLFMAGYWYQEAASRGDKEAMSRLATVFKLVAPPNLDAAHYWYEQAAAAGDADAMYQLGLLSVQADPPDEKAGEIGLSRRPPPGTSLRCITWAFRSDVRIRPI